MSVVVRLENVSKRYQLGGFSTQTVRGDFQRWWSRVRGQEDPFSKIGEKNSKAGEFWALKDISFDIQQGEAVGIIGKNGAGKSTLLKILSRITLPTTGSVRVKGRIASLLEVGTGFNPDLSGRENIYLNGAILGMTKNEVKARFDEIVDFSGIEKFIDTPVKRYSSGMYVRLAFSVAAHLESEILILDEVLAVGDSEFQKKCLKKIDDVTHKDGRTIIFVSHDISSIRRICQKVLYLERGRISMDGRVYEVTEEYQLTTNKKDDINRLETSVGDDQVRFVDFKMFSPTISQPYFCLSKEECLFSFVGIFNKYVEGAQLGFVLRNLQDELLISANSMDNNGSTLNIDKGKHEFSFKLKMPLKASYYQIEIAIIDKSNSLLDHWIIPQKITVLSNTTTILSENWQGWINEPVEFSWKSKN